MTLSYQPNPSEELLLLIRVIPRISYVLFPEVNSIKSPKDVPVLCHPELQILIFFFFCAIFQEQLGMVENLGLYLHTSKSVFKSRFFKQSLLIFFSTDSSRCLHPLRWLLLIFRAVLPLEMD